jgi:DNA-directed RNA polymerase specialized sigma24 family protein
MRWINYLLETRLFRKEIDKIKTSLAPKTLDDLDNLPSNEEEDTPLKRIKQYLEQDPENLCKQEFIENHPDANFQVICLKKVNGQTWKSMSEEFGIKIPTLSRFYERTLKKLAAQIEAHCKD